MTKKQPEETKLLVLPSDLVDRLKEASSKKGTSLSGFAMEILEEGLRAEQLGTPLDAAVDAYKMREIHRGAGAVIVPRGSLGQLIENLGDRGIKDLGAVWEETGRWYGKYLSGKLTGKDLLKFLRQDLMTSWNLDEVDITEGDEMTLRFTGFMMSEAFTTLLLSYLRGLMESLGYNEVEHDSMRGMATIKYLHLKRAVF